MNVLTRIVVKSVSGVYCMNHNHPRNLQSLSYYSIWIEPTTFYSSSSRSFNDASLRHRFLLSRCTQFPPISALNRNWNTTKTCCGLIHTTLRYNHQIANNNNENSDIDIANRVEDHIQTLCNENKIDEAFKVFSSHITQNGAIQLITCCKNKGDENSQRLAMKVYHTLISSNITPNIQLFSNLIYLCNKVDKFNDTLTLLSDIEKYQIKLNESCFSNLIFATYKTNNKTAAKKLVDIIKNGVDFQPLTKHCNSLLLTLENIDDCIWLMDFMLKNNIEIYKGCFITLFKTCISSKPLAYKYGKQLYNRLLKTPHSTDKGVLNYVLQVFTKCGDINQAIKVFETIEQPDLILWSCMIGLCAKNGEPYKSVELYDKMIENNITPDKITFMNILTAISNLGPNAIKLGEQIHQQIIQHKLDSDVILISSLIQMYNKCGEPNKSIELYDKMIENNITPDKITFTNILTAISNLGPNAIKLGEYIHQQIIQHKLDSDVILISSLIQMYDKCGEPNKSIEVYDKMIENNITPNEIIFTNILTAISNLGPNAIKLGEYIHQQIIQHKFDSNMILQRALRKMYDKCGETNK